MKKIIFISLSLLLSVLGVKATNTAYTTVDELTNNYFMLVNDTDGTNKCMYLNDSTNVWTREMLFGGNPTVIRNDAYRNNANFYNYLFKAEKVAVGGTDYYKVRCYNYNSGEITLRSSAIGVENGDPVLNLGKGSIFIGKISETSYGVDYAKGGLWNIVNNGNGTFSFQSVADNTVYLGTADNTGYKGSSTNKAAWKCYDVSSFVTTLATTQTKFTAVSDLENNLFTISDAAGKVLGNVTGNQFKMNTTANAICSDRSYLFNAEKVTIDGDANTYYRLALYNYDASFTGTYLNVASWHGLFYGVCSSTLGIVYGQDFTYGGLWTITAKDGGFTFQNVGLKTTKSDVNNYINGTGTTNTETTMTCSSHYFANSDYTRTNTSADKYLTICLPYAATVSGATLYTLKGVDSKTTPTKTYLEATNSTSMTAGTPYIIKTTATADVTFTCDFSTTYTDAASVNGLVGNYYKTTASATARVETGKTQYENYVLSSNKWLKVVSDSLPTIGVNRAYLYAGDATVVTEGAAANEMTLDFDDSETTGMDEQSVTATDVMTDDSWYSLQGVKMGTPTTKGIYIKGGKKFIFN